ncbi:hypothetical protein DMH04_35690 [Kibdelosporangium aridum]|uniref:PE domain-containing protein n=1 Tax=Kibdelosporangium aridum TaxID=2030 RepID=A0A428YZW7_KIBAR|nr:hypothetical protein [Kibdelosporangium aridum]RSM76992.1 hypothetical protein DMH04_35690 [Kibdelosporangium aridum]
MYEDLGGSAQPDIGWADIGKNIGSIGASMSAFAGAAAAGGFEVNEAGGKALITAIQKMRDWANGQETKLYQIAQELPLGDSNAAKVMKPYLQQVAVDNQGFLTQLAAFRESLDKAEKGIDTAMANYRATEAANAASMRKTGP